MVYRQRPYDDAGINDNAIRCPLHNDKKMHKSCLFVPDKVYCV